MITWRPPIRAISSGARQRSHHLHTGSLNHTTYRSCQKLHVRRRTIISDSRVQTRLDEMAIPGGTTALNATEFDQPHWKIIARGLDTEKWFNEGQAVGTGGILMPEPTRVPASQYYYRFASSTSP